MTSQTAEAATAPLRTMADSAFPGNVPRTVNGKTPDIVLIYAGGDTPHPWSTPEILAMPERYRWPCWVRSNPAQVDPASDAAMFAAWLLSHRVPQQTAVILDLETAVNTGYVATFNLALREAGYRVTKYGSQSTIWRNPRTDGGTFLALPGKPELTGEGDEVARQYGFEGSYDVSVVLASVPLWDTRPPPPPHPAPHGRHAVDGTISLHGLARWCKTTPERVLWLTANAMPTGWGRLQRAYVHAGDWSALLPKGTVVWLP